MRLALVICTLHAAAGLLAACANGSGLDLASGPFAQSTLAYVPTAEEQSLDCGQLTYVLDKTIERINALPATALKQRDDPPTSVMMAVSRVSGGGIAAVHDYEAERTHAQSLIRQMGHKGCAPIDLDARTKEASDKLAAFRGG